MRSVVDDFRWWYGPILPSDDSFPFACQQTLTGFLLAVSSHLSRKRPADTFLNFLTNATSIFIVFLGELSSSLMAPNVTDLSTSEAVHLYLEENPDSNLANVLNVDEQQKKFKSIAEDILQTFLDSKAYNCEPVRVFLREILAGTILEMTLKSCSKPDWINGWIVYLLEEGEPDIMNAIDAGVGGATMKEIKNATAQAELNSSTLSHGNRDVLPADASAILLSHRRKISEAEEAMDQAMLEAKRLSELIAAEDSKRDRLSEDAASSGYATGATATPTSSQSDLHSNNEDRQGSSTQISPTTLSQGPASFTNFDQILSSHQPIDRNSQESIRTQGPPPLTLYNAKVTIFDDSQPGEKANIRTKPTVDYLLQIEPASSQHPGWMIARKYADFETLHEVLRRISVISGVPLFTQRYSAVPTWKGHTKAALCILLERYLHEALSHSRLAESEGMKRFLEKDQGLAKLSAGSNKNVLGFPSPAVFETMGKGMLDVLVSAPKGAAGGGKMLFEGVSGVLGGQKKPGLPPRPSVSSRSGSVNSFSRPIDEHTRPRSSTASHGRISQEALQPLGGKEVPGVSSQPRRTTTSNHDVVNGVHTAQVLRNSHETVHSPEISPKTLIEGDRASAILNGITTQVEPAMPLHLPPLPSEISDDYKSTAESLTHPLAVGSSAVTRSSTMLAPTTTQSPSPSPSRNGTAPSSEPTDEVPIPPKQEKSLRKTPSPLTEQETSVAVELFFAVINELYTLSSAWNIRRTLLNAAKTFLLRPGNPNLEAIRVLLQDTVIEANTSDAGLAMHLIKLRENALPTEEELAAWPQPLSKDEQEALRMKARKLLVEKGMPQALTSVMGAAASGEALGRVFDSLQVEEVARGLMFALILQGARAITH